MKLFLILFVFVLSLPLRASEEAKLKDLCLKGDLAACEGLAGHYVEVKSWDKAQAIGEALCQKDSAKGCTITGSALISLGKLREGFAFLTKGCDGFEPFACKSLAKLMERGQEKELAFMYRRRACFYGLKEACRNLTLPKKLFSASGNLFLKDLRRDCDDTASQVCKEKLKMLETCPAPLTKNDCVLIPGELSVFFRAKLVQETAKLGLLQLQVLQEDFRKVSGGKYTYDLKKLVKPETFKAKTSYVLGFQKACMTYYERSRQAQSSTLTVFKEAHKELSARTRRNINAYFSREKGRDCYDPKIGYEAFAIGSLDSVNNAKLDIWKINRDGNLLHVQDGLPDISGD